MKPPPETPLQLVEILPEIGRNREAVHSRQMKPVDRVHLDHSSELPFLQELPR